MKEVAYLEAPGGNMAWSGLGVSLVKSEVLSSSLTLTTRWSYLLLDLSYWSASHWLSFFTLLHSVC